MKNNLIIRIVPLITILLIIGCASEQVVKKDSLAKILVYIGEGSSGMIGSSSKEYTFIDKSNSLETANLNVDLISLYKVNSKISTIIHLGDLIEAKHVYLFEDILNEFRRFNKSLEKYLFSDCKEHISCNFFQISTSPSLPSIDRSTIKWSSTKLTDDQKIFFLDNLSYIDTPDAQVTIYDDDIFLKGVIVKKNNTFIIQTQTENTIVFRQTEIKKGEIVLLTAQGLSTKRNLIAIEPTWRPIKSNILEITPEVGSKVTVKGLNEGVTDIVVEYSGIQKILKFSVK